jgi:hypothetical protein
MFTWRIAAQTRSTGGRDLTWKALLIAVLTLTLVGAAPSASRAAETPAVADPGPVVTLPFSNRLFPYPTTGGAGPESLNSLVAQECNSGAPLLDQQWFTLPADGAGLLVARAQRGVWYGAARSPSYIPVGVAVVDHDTGQVIGCGSEPVTLADGQHRSLVAWTHASGLNECTADEGCWVDPLEVFANWTSGPPVNDRWQDAKPISAVPYRNTVDTTFATDDGPGLTPFCSWSMLDPADVQTVWWRFTPTVSGALPLYAEGETYGPPWNQQVFDPSVAIGRLTDAGPAALPHDPETDCEEPRPLVEVQAGTTYLISVHDYIDPSMDTDLMHGGRATLTLGALRPTAAQDVTATPDDKKIVVSWSPPQHSGSSAITEYRIRQLPSGPATTVPADAHSYTWTELTNGQPYAFEVTAVNASGAGNPARTPEVEPTFDARLPTEPTGVDLDVDTDTLTATLTWAPPASAGASAITGYRVTRSGSDSTGAGPVSTLLPASARSYVFSKLKYRTAYAITVRAVNAVGDGRSADTGVTIVDWTPPEPRSVTAVPGVLSARVSWDPPFDLGQSLPSEYRVRRYAAGSSTPEATTTVPATTLFLTVTGLTAGTAYTFDVAAISEAGVSDPARSAPVTPTASPVVPPAPTAVGASLGGTAGTATLTWEPPVWDGGVPITGYRVSRNGRDSGGAGPWSTTVPASARTFTFTHLNVWDTYALTVQAINSVGTGPAATRSVTITAATPSAPTTVRATPGKGSVTVTWRPPLYGSAPTGYRIRRYAATGTTVQATTTVAASARSFTATGLTNGTPYRFDVTAINGWGTGRPSAITSAVIPVTVPSAPTIGTATAGTTGGTITAKAAWTAPSSTGGSPITGYRVTALRVNAAGDVLGTTVSAIRPATERSFSMTLPQTGKYQFTVQAVNAVGNGAASGRSNVVLGR